MKTPPSSLPPSYPPNYPTNLGRFPSGSFPSPGSTPLSDASSLPPHSGPFPFAPIPHPWPKDYSTPNIDAYLKKHYPDSNPYPFEPNLPPEIDGTYLHENPSSPPRFHELYPTSAEPILRKYSLSPSLPQPDPDDRNVPPLPAFDTDPWMYRFPQYRDDNYYQNEMRQIPHKTLEPLFDDQGIIRDDYDDAEWEASLKYAPPDVRNDLINANPKYKLPPFGTYKLTPAERARNIGKSLVGAARDFVDPAGISSKAFNTLRGAGELIGDKIADGMQWAYDKYVDPGNPPVNPFRAQSPEDLETTLNNIGNFDLNEYAGY